MGKKAGEKQVSEGDKDEKQDDKKGDEAIENSKGVVAGGKHAH